VEWLIDPTAWVGLVTLVLLELVLGIDNLVFIAILAEKLPPSKRDKARQLGLALALLMRVVLLFGISWLATLVDPFLFVAGYELSGRDLIFLLGGFFLLYKATNEIHVRLEGTGHEGERNGYRPQFWMVVAQIVVLDAVFSLDAVITAVGMVEHLEVMILAVTLAILLMLWISKPLTAFVSRHPTVVMLCLGFLLMVGFSLVAEGLGYHVPKGYLYAAIGFSVLIEFFNQFAQARLKSRVASSADLRARSADAVLRLLGAKRADEEQNAYEFTVLLQQAGQQNHFSHAEKELLRGVLNLSERPVSAIMTPRSDVEWIDLSQPESDIAHQILETKRSSLLVSDGTVDNVVGILQREDILLRLSGGGGILPLQGLIREPMYVHEGVVVLKLLEMFKRTPAPLAVVMDEHGSVMGVITHHDILEAIGGEFPDHVDTVVHPAINIQSGGIYVVEGSTSIIDVRDRTGFPCESDGNYATLAGFILHELARLPKEGDMLDWNGWTLTILKLDGNRIASVQMKKHEEEE
jgi:CBS domain containing-hemolysin-like protein